MRPEFKDRSTYKALQRLRRVPATPTLWSVLVNAMTAFVNDVDSEFLDVALQFFPLSDPACDAAVYAVPAVPMGPLPGNAESITNALAQPSQGLFTPIEPALRGMTSFCDDYQTNNPDEECVGVLITDGSPTACNLDPNVLIGIAQDAYDNSDVKTFAVGMLGSDFNLLDPIAMWGGTDCVPGDPDAYACDASTDSATSLPLALETVREQVKTMETKTEYRTEITTGVSECDWGIPDLPGGVDFGVDIVNVKISKSGQNDILIGRVEGMSRCDEVDDGWFFDDRSDPSMLIACPQTCEMIEDMEGEKITLLLGCETVLAEDDAGTG